MSRRPSAVSALTLATLAAFGLTATAATAASAAPAAPGTAVGSTAATTTAARTAVDSGAATTSDPAGTQRVELALTPRDPAGLRTLAAQASTLPAAVRTARLAQVLAGTGRADEVAAQARALGFTVTSTSATGVTVTGPAALVRANFGSAREHDALASAAQPLPTMPASMHGLVLVAAGGDETRGARHPEVTTRAAAASAAALTQAGVRAAYQVPGVSAAPTANSPSIATIQFSSWNAADLTKYAAATGVYGSTSYDPVSGGGYTAVQVDGGATDASGAEEVSLDQSALATAAPQLRQVAYFAPNNTALGQADVLNQIAADAQSRKIVAVSTSWGQCEQATYDGPNDPLLAADQNSIYAAQAAGVTVFAVSGDNGAYDCVDSDGNAITSLRAVDSPGSFPTVTAVGGTTVNTSAGYAQSAWDGSGGGYSTLFCATTAQAAILPAAAGSGTRSASCPTRKARGLPDLAMDADPATGLTIFVNGNASTYGGTSLAAPLAAGAWAQTLLATGYLAGVGPINDALDRSLGSNGFTDITTGSNSTTAATPGWDAVTGEGSPNWTPLAPRVLGTSSARSVYDVTQSGGASNRVEIRELSQASGYQTVTKQIATALPAVRADEWQFFVGPYANDGQHDLLAVHYRNTASGKVELHVLSEASAYQSFIAHSATALAAVAAGQWEFGVGSYGGDRQANLFAIRVAGSASGHVEIHVLSAASGYAGYATHAATPIASTTPAEWRFLVGDGPGNGNVVGVKLTGTGSGKAEVHILRKATNYSTFWLHAATPLSLKTAALAQFAMTTSNGGAPADLMFALASGTGSGRTEVHTISGASSYTAYSLHAATALPLLDPALNTVSLIY